MLMSQDQCRHRRTSPPHCSPSTPQHGRSVCVRVRGWETLQAPTNLKSLGVLQIVDAPFFATLELWET